MSRVKWKSPYVNNDLLAAISDGEKTIVTNSRNSTIIPCFVGLQFTVHNGKIFNKIKITEKMIGYKLGEFSPTRKKFNFKKKKKK